MKRGKQTERMLQKKLAGLLPQRKMAKRVMAVCLAAVTAIASMGASIGMMAPVAVQAEGTNGETAPAETGTVTITNVSSAAIAASITGEDDADFSKWSGNAKKVGTVTFDTNSVDGNTIIVNAELGSMEKMTRQGPTKDTRAFPIVVTLNKVVEQSYWFKGSESGDPTNKDRVTTAWKFVNAYSDKPEGYEQKYCVVWLSEEWTGEGFEITFDKTNYYKIKVVDTTDYDISADIENAKVEFKKGGSVVSGESLKKARVGEEYAVTITADAGYIFSEEDGAALKAAGYTESDGGKTYTSTCAIKLNVEGELGEDGYVNEYMALEGNKISVVPDGVTAAVEITKETLTSSDVEMKYETGKLVFKATGTYIVEKEGGTSEEHKVDNANDETYTVDSSMAGKTIKVIKKAETRIKTNSDPLSIEIKNAPKPTGLSSTNANEEGSDGKISGVTDSMEYASAGVEPLDWKACSNSEVGGLSAGTYYVRYKSNDSVETKGFASDSNYATVIIGTGSEEIISLEADQASYSKSVVYGYDGQPAFTIKISNNGNADMTTPGNLVLTSLDGEDDFTLDGDGTFAIINKEATSSDITVKAKNGLNAGEYKATLKVTYEETKELIINITLNVEMAKWTAPTGTLTATSSENGKITINAGEVVKPDESAALEYGYSASSSMAPTSGTSNLTITDVPAGEHYVFVRAKEDNNHYASDWLMSNEKVKVASATASGGTTGGQTPSGDDKTGGTGGSGSSSNSGSSSSSGSGTGTGTGTGGGSSSAATPANPGTETTVKNPDGSTTTTTTTTRSDGTKVTTSTTTATDGTKTETVTETKPDGTKTETTAETRPDGTKTESVTEKAADGSVIKSSETFTASDGSAVKTEIENTRNAAGNDAEVTTTTKTDTAGAVTSITEETTIPESSDTTSTVVTVKKDGTGEVTSAKAAVENTVPAGKAVLSASVVSQITEAAGTDSVTITMTVKDGEGKVKYKVKADTEDLEGGNKLYIYKLDSVTGRYIMVDAKTYAVSSSGNVSLSMKENATYELVDKKKAAKINKEIRASITPKKAAANVKPGKKTSFKLSKKADMENIKSIVYATSNKKVAGISKNGKITAKKGGTVTMKAKVTLKNGSTKTIKMKIEVK